MKMSYYPGCSLTGTSKEYDESVREVAGLLGMELLELPDWNCCGASSAHMTDHDLSVRLSARNLDIAQNEGNNVLVPCAACFQRLKAADKALREDPGRWNRDDYSPNFNIVHMTTRLCEPEMLDRIRASVKRSLSGLKVACYYGCLSLRPPKVTGASDYERPMGLDMIVEALGGEPVHWSHKTECCGGSLTMTRSDISLKLIGDIVEAAARGGAEAIVVDCPMCQANLDSRQMDLAAGRTEQLPVFFATELIAAALTERAGGKLKGHLVDPLVLVERMSSQA